MPRNNIRLHAKNPAKERGSFMIEALVGLVLFAVGMIALMGMAAQAMNTVGQSKYRSDASDLAQELVGSMWVSASTPSAFNTDAWLTRVQTSLPAGGAIVSVRADGVTVDIEVSWSDKKDSAGNAVRHRYLTTAIVAKNT